MPSLYKANNKNEGMELEEVRYWAEGSVWEQTRAINYEKYGFTGNDISIHPISFGFCLKRRMEKDDMLTSDEIEELREKYDTERMIENAILEYKQGIEKKAERFYNCNHYDIRIMRLKNGVFIKWNKKPNVKAGTLKMFRRTGHFSKNAFSDDNGDLVVTSHYSVGEEIDYIESGETYFYTVLYRELRGETSFLGFVKKPRRTYLQVQFNVRLDELSVEEKEDVVEKVRENLEIARKVSEVEYKDKLEQLKTKIKYKQLERDSVEKLTLDNAEAKIEAVMNDDLLAEEERQYKCDKITEQADLEIYAYQDSGN